MNQEEKSRLSREFIIKAALIEFTKMGFEHASLNHICREYKISKGRFYHHFSSKDDLFLACCNWIYATANSLIQLDDLDIYSTLEEKLHLIFLARMQILVQNPYVAGLWFARNTPPPHLKKQVMEIRHASYDYASKLINYAFRQSGHFDPDKILIYQEMFVIASSRTQQKMLHDWNPADSAEQHQAQLAEAARRFDQIIHIFLYGILSQEEKKAEDNSISKN